MQPLSIISCYIVKLLNELCLNIKANILSLSCLIFSIHLLAQNGKNELAVGYGIYTTITKIESSAEFSSDGLSAGMTSSNKVYTGSFHVGYKYYDYLSQVMPVAIGGTFLYEQIQSQAFLGNIEAGWFNDNYYTLIGEIKMIYLNKEKLLLYGIMAGGATFCTRKFTSNENHQTDNTCIVHLNFQLTPIGIKYGNRFGVFAELGLGSKGIVCTGVFARF